MTDNPDALLAWAVGIAHEAGDIMRQYFDVRANRQIRTKADRTPVTIADTQVNDLVIRRAANDFPDHGVLGEEASHQATRRQLWVCDPIDGTAAFILGFPSAMFSLAHVVDGRPEVAVTYEPMLDKLFTAVRGRGAQLNGQTIHVSEQAVLAGAKIGSTSLKQALERQAFFAGLLAEGAELVGIYGAVYKAMLVAQGRIDGSVFPGRSAHDMAAAKLIVEEAGGTVTDLYGHDQRYDGKIKGAIISNGRLHEVLVQQMAAFDPEKYLGY